MQQSFYSNGKLLLTGEYFILDGAEGLALPTTCGQDLIVLPKNDACLTWKSFTNTGEVWLEVVFDLPRLRIVSADFESNEDGGNDTLAESLHDILLAVRELNPKFLVNSKGVEVQTHLTFPRNWGLGTSSTLISSLANWAEVDPYELLKRTFGGSGYDIACAQTDTGIVFKIEEGSASVKPVNFNPSFKEQLYFVYLNQKQNSREGIKRYKELKGELTGKLIEINKITKQFLKCDSIVEFEQLIESHEKIVAEVIQYTPVKEQLFSDYFGAVKSLGAWGGDFVLVTGNSRTPNYFKEKGYGTVIPYVDLILN